MYFRNNIYKVIQGYFFSVDLSKPVAPASSPHAFGFSFFASFSLQETLKQDHIIKKDLKIR